MSFNDCVLAAGNLRVTEFLELRNTRSFFFVKLITNKNVFQMKLQSKKEQIISLCAVFLIIYVLCLVGFQDMINGLRLIQDENGVFKDYGMPGVKQGNKWIVVTSVRSPTEDVKRLSSFSDWNLVVVADTQTPLDWELENVHFLSVEIQKKLPFYSTKYLPYKSYTRKNIGYLYAIYQGAEWIYDTDDDNKPFGLGLKQFDYEDTISGLRYQVQEKNETEINKRLFNPYQFYGIRKMWPRGFPLEFIGNHSNNNGSQVLCYEMERSAVQQGLVHHDPDVDAVYRLLNADSRKGLNVEFNKFAPPITLSVGTYSPWNSQNTLFHKSAFHTLFLPTTVSFRTTDIWRSYISQKILHLSGLTVSFVPTNAVQFRNAHHYLKDFKDEKRVYEDSGALIEFLHSWKCSSETQAINATEILENCIQQFSDDLVKNKFWGKEDSRLFALFLRDLKGIGFQFPKYFGDSYKDSFIASSNEKTRDVNCRRMHLEFDLIDPKSNEDESIRKAAEKLNYFGDIIDWCNEPGYFNSTGFPHMGKALPSPKHLAAQHEKTYELQKVSNSVLILVNNFPWKYGMGLLQRLYQPYFAALIFCGSWYPNELVNEDNFTSTIYPANFIHLNPEEMRKGYFGYHCMTLVKEMRLNNIEGYFYVADDTAFNIWQRIDYSKVHHLTGVALNGDGGWWNSEFGMPAAENIVAFMKNTTNPKLISTWKEYEDRMREFGFLSGNKTAYDEVTSGESRTEGDFFYIPTKESELYAVLMRVFYENKFFLELAVNKFLKGVKYQTPLISKGSYLWEHRENWPKLYNKSMVAMHPIKISPFRKVGENRRNYCATVVKSWWDIIYRGSRDFLVKYDNETSPNNG